MYGIAHFLQAAKYRIVYPRALIMVVGWYAPMWWEGSEEEQMDLMERYRCTVAAREGVMDYVVGPRNAGMLFTNASRVADSGIVSMSISNYLPPLRHCGPMATENNVCM